MKVSIVAGVLSVVGLFLCGVSAIAQLKVTSPVSRAVFQRDNANNSTIHVVGTYSQPVSSVEARLVKMADGQGIDTDWVVIQQNPQGGVFQGPLKAKGGWYRLEVRGLLGGIVVAQDVVQRVGIGEVFIITGQSNAQGLPDRGAVGAADDRVNCVTYDNSVANTLNDPSSFTYQPLTADALVGPRGQTAWCWGVLGDLIARQYNVPVLFINTGWAGTSIRNWMESSNGQPTKNIWRIGTPDENFPKGMPYGNLLISLQYFSSLQGLRAVLWQQGETDNIPLNLKREEYRSMLQYIINKTRADTKRYPAWILARSSVSEVRSGVPVVSNDIIAAQNDVINTFNNNVYAGPFLDDLQVPRPDGTHFAGLGLRQLGERWFASMDNRFFSSSIPLLPLPPPSLNVTCAANNQSLMLSLSDGVKDINETRFQFADITWSNGQKGRTIAVTTPGTYYAIAKDEKNTTFISPSVNVTSPIQPATPVIMQVGQQQACTDSTFTFTTNSPVGNALTWSNGTVAPKLLATIAGDYTVRATNVYGCVSGLSAPANLIIRPKQATPTVEQAGPFSLQAKSPANSVPVSGYQWRTDSQMIPGEVDVIKATQNGRYAARSTAIYTIGSNLLTCYSNFSSLADYILVEKDRAMAVYPNPSEEGLVHVETRENLTNAELGVYTLSGQLVYAMTMPVLDNRKTFNLSGLLAGDYIVRIKADNFNVSKRVRVR